MFAAVCRHTQAGIDRRRAERGLPRIEEIKQDNAPRSPVRLVKPRLSLADEIARQKREQAVQEAEERAKEYRASREKFEHTYALIEKRICRALKITRADILSTSRKTALVFARQAIMYWTCRLTERTLPEIGRLMGGFDHTTILHGRRVYPKKRAKMSRNLRALG